MARAKSHPPIPGDALRPMLATLTDAAFDDANWIFETKWDGYRVVAKIERGTVKLLSRNGIDLTANYPAIAAALAKINHQAVIDGELVALDEAGRSRFQLLQNAGRDKTRLRYYAFDVMFLDGVDLRRTPLIDRKEALRLILPKSSLLRYSRHVVRDGTKAFRAAAEDGLEGVMAKRARGFYYSGKRSREWLKLKTVQRQEVVIVGYTAPRKSREHFGALVLALRDGDTWRYAGHAGTGFDAKALRSIHAMLQPLVTRTRPFQERTPNERQTTWVKPKLVAEVKFSEWTSDGQMRHPAFVGLRSDKPARNVVPERALPRSARTRSPPASRRAVN